MGLVLRPLWPLLVPNVPCGVESQKIPQRTAFYTVRVPNVPCGVESFGPSKANPMLAPVPNVPCGVERLILTSHHASHCIVPNVPCGVERRAWIISS